MLQHIYRPFKVCGKRRFFLCQILKTGWCILKKEALLCSKNFLMQTHVILGHNFQKERRKKSFLKSFMNVCPFLWSIFSPIKSVLVKRIIFNDFLKLINFYKKSKVCTLVECAANSPPICALSSSLWTRPSKVLKNVRQQITGGNFYCLQFVVVFTSSFLHEATLWQFSKSFNSKILGTSLSSLKKNLITFGSFCFTFLYDLDPRVCKEWKSDF